MHARKPALFFLMAALSLIMIAVLAGTGSAQAPEPSIASGLALPVCTTNLPPELVARTAPSRVVYVGSAPGSTARVIMQATGTADPEGQGVEYACDANGDGVFTPWFFHEPCAEEVSMPGPFLAEIRVRDEGKAMASQVFSMAARQFEHSVHVWGWGAPSLAIVAGRPAMTFMGEDGLYFAINSHSDGGGLWAKSRVFPIDLSRQTDQLSRHPCPLGVVNGALAAVCAYRTAGGFPVMWAQNSQPDGSGKWQIEEAIALAADSAPTLGSLWTSPAIAFFQDGAVTVLTSVGAAGVNPVKTGESMALLWSFDVGAAPPEAHSPVVLVGGDARLPALVYLDAKKSALIYAVNQQRDGLGKFDIVQIERQAGDIGAPSLVVLNGRPVVAYRDGATGDLKIAEASTPDGRGTWRVRVVAPGRAGLGTPSLTVADGRLAVAYGDAARGLVFAYDPGFDNGDYWPSVVADSESLMILSGNSSGRRLSPSMALVAGRPAIAYGSLGGIALAVAR